MDLSLPRVYPGERELAQKREVASVMLELSSQVRENRGFVDVREPIAERCVDQPVVDLSEIEEGQGGGIVALMISAVKKVCPGSVPGEVTASGIRWRPVERYVDRRWPQCLVSVIIFSRSSLLNFCYSLFQIGQPVAYTAESPAVRRWVEESDFSHVPVVEGDPWGGLLGLLRGQYPQFYIAPWVDYSQSLLRAKYPRRYPLGEGEKECLVTIVRPVRS